MFESAIEKPIKEELDMVEAGTHAGTMLVIGEKDTMCHTREIA